MIKRASVPVVVAAAVGIALIGFSAVAQPKPIVVWNASASVPVGLYSIISGIPKLGHLVLVRTPDSVKTLADKRRYLPPSVPLVKRISAVSGDVVCAINRTVAINGTKVAFQLKADRAGRRLPRWNGCQRLKRDEYFLLGSAPDSFDSRYFGPVKNVCIIGRLVPLWTE